LASVVAIVLAAAFAASWIPARRAARMSPHDALRYE
jgi:ABC-type lipoprotein release transport system permease subunit